MNASDTIKNGATLWAPSGLPAIAINDLVLASGYPAQLYTVKVADFAAVSAAGTACIPTTTASSGATTSSQRRDILQSQVDGSIFVLAADTSGGFGLQVLKYTAGGALVDTLVLDSTSGVSASNPCMSLLSTGNICVVWPGASNLLAFEIFDQNFNIIAAKTTIAAAPANVFFNSIPLSAGGFAVAYPASTGVFLAIYSNTGAVVSAPALMASTPVGGLAVKMVQQSGGNIAFAINSSASGKALGHAIYSVTGTLVLGYTVLDSATSSGSQYPEIAELTGFYCCALYSDGTNCAVYVLNNAGAVQGSAFATASATPASNMLKILNDGTAFWVCIFGVGGLSVYAPTSGAGYVSSAMSAITGYSAFDAFIEHNMIVVAGGTANILFNMESNGTVRFKATVAAGLASGVTNVCAIPGGDFTVIASGAVSGTGTVFDAFKYATTSIFGISQAAVAAGVGGTIVPCNEGPGGYSCNPMLGTSGKAFDHSGSTMVGNKGTLFGNSVALKGI